MVISWGLWLSWCAKKSTPFAAQTAVRVALQPCIDRGLQTAEVIL